MIRRTHLDELFGAPLLKLPKTSASIWKADFNELERRVYDIARKRMIERINQISAVGKLRANYSNIFAMLLRLRQLTGHILTIEGTLKDVLLPEDLDEI